MSRKFLLYAADESEAEEICERPNKREDGIFAICFDEYKQLSLLSMFREVTAPVRQDASDYSFLKAYLDGRAETGKFEDEINAGLGNLLAKHADLEKSYCKHFKVLYSEFGDECFVTRFPDELVEALADVDNDALPILAEQWQAIEPGLDKAHWPRTELEDLLKAVIYACKAARASKKHVLVRLSL
ncbi:MAG: hypothetical protein U0105_09715 [Candidatus Obscuribacterales bacterium]